jgi:hypothetical protein
MTLDKLSDSKYTYVDRLYCIVNFWKDTHQVTAIHMSPTMCRALAHEIQGARGEFSNVATFMGLPIRYCDIDGCDDGTTAPCFSVVTGSPLRAVQDEATEIGEGLALLKMGTLTEAQFRQYYQMEWVPEDTEIMASKVGGAFAAGKTVKDQELLAAYWQEQLKDNELPPEGYVWE